MSAVSRVFLLAAGQDPQCVVDRGIRLSSFRFTKHEKPPENSFLGVVCRCVLLVRDSTWQKWLAVATLRPPAAASRPPGQRCNRQATAQIWRGWLRGDWRADHAVCLPR